MGLKSPVYKLPKTDDKLYVTKSIYGHEPLFMK